MFVWVWEFYNSQSELKDLEIVMQQGSGSQRFTVKFIALTLSFSYDYKVYVYTHRYTGIGPLFWQFCFLIWNIFPPSAVNNINLLSAAIFYPHNIWLLSIYKCSN